MPRIGKVEITNLLLDLENPRLSEPCVTQTEALHSIALKQERKLQVLAGDILEYGINPSDLPLIIPVETDPAENDEIIQYTVLDGNRRLVALKALADPTVLP